MTLDSYSYVPEHRHSACEFLMFHLHYLGLSSTSSRARRARNADLCFTEEEMGVQTSSPSCCPVSVSETFPQGGSESSTNSLVPGMNLSFGKRRDMLSWPMSLQIQKSYAPCKLTTRESAGQHLKQKGCIQGVCLSHYPCH